MIDAGFQVGDSHETLAGARVVHDGTGTVITLWGAHDLVSADPISEVIARVVTGGDGDVIIDVAAVSFLDASTLGPIARAHGLLTERSRRLTLRRPSPRAERLLRICDLDELIEVPLST